ncbi:MAG TPA: nucleoside transporter C-terminal domain-containing protein [Candidatus Polarisedimenticolaceae bacterium]|nr:nucleoside transporter C-terminal domain-containing protein [Candidatus Polarisedimenticolaceae bacterium]
MSVLNLVSLAGIAVLSLVAWLAGGCRRPVPLRTVRGSLVLMIATGTLVFLVPQSRQLLVRLNDLVVAALGSANAGAEFLFGPLAVGPGRSTAAGESSIGFVLAAQVLPAVVFFTALMALFYFLGLVQPVVRVFGRLFHRSLGLSGAESLSGAANIFLGVESVTTIRPYLDGLTRSELLTVLTCCMSTVASTTLAIYVLFLDDVFPRIAGHLISASVISIPAAALVSKLMLPETERPATRGHVPPLPRDDRAENPVAALTAGAWDGLRLAAGIATLLIAVLGIVGLVDLGLNRISQPFADRLGGVIDVGRILGWVFTPLTLLLGVEPADVSQAGRLLGQRLVVTEVPTYRELAELSAAGAISPRTMLILSYALCGFAHVASVGIFVGGISAIAPTRRADLAALAPRALLGATLATLLTGALAGLFYHGQGGVLAG